MSATPPTRDEALAYFEEMSVYLFNKAFNRNLEDPSHPPMPPVLPGSRVLHDVRHQTNCMCSICMEARYGVAGL